MSDKSNIEWCDSTFNPWIGCTKVGPGCDHCYAEADFDHRKHRVKWGAGNPRSRTSAENWRKPLRWERDHEQFFAEHGRRRRVFCASLADVFDNEVNPDWRHDLFQLIHDTPHLDWLLLTKRIGNALKLVDPAVFEELTNIWIGATVVTQEEVDRDIPKLLDVPARVRFLSMEPLLGPIELRQSWRDFLEGWDVEPVCCGRSRGDGCCGDPEPQQVQTERIDWVICGGESGLDARPMHPDWARSLRDQCQTTGVPFFMKQMGGATKRTMQPIPDDLMIREFPTSQ